MRSVSRKGRIEAYEIVTDMARRYGLIESAVSGTVFIMHPETQDMTGVTERCLRMACITETETEPSDDV